MPKFANSPLALILAPLIATAALATPAMANTGQQTTRLDVEVKERSGTTVYCVSQQLTNSYAPQKICRTRAEWIDAGATFRTTAKLALNDTAQEARN